MSRWSRSRSPGTTRTSINSPPPWARSFERFGFAVIEDHGLPPDRLDAALADAKAFFALPEAVKRAYIVPGGAGQRGYTPFGVETAKDAAHHDLKEFWHIGRERVGAPNVWPGEAPGFRASLGGLYADLDALGLKLLRGVAAHLGLAPDAFAPAVQGGDSVLRLLHYPPVSGAPAAVRAAAHEDINAITLLLGAEEAGLELLDRDGRWLGINPPPGSVVVNIGDMLQRLTNHVLPSTTHRVINPGRPERRGIVALLHALLPAFRAGLPDRDAGRLYRRRPARPLSRTDHRRGMSSRAPARDRAGRLNRPAQDPSARAARLAETSRRPGAGLGGFGGAVTRRRGRH